MARSRSQKLSRHFRDEKLLRELLRADHNCLRGGSRTKSDGEGCVCKDCEEPRHPHPTPRSRSVSVTCAVSIEHPDCKIGRKSQFSRAIKVAYAVRRQRPPVNIRKGELSHEPFPDRWKEMYGERIESVCSRTAACR